MFGISLGHLIILGIILLIFGPKRLPTIGRSIGKGLKNFKDGLHGVKNAEFRRIDPDSETPSEKVEKPKE